jgi:hypothetical protein
MPKACKKSQLDDILNPALLAHQVLNLDSLAEDYEYPRKLRLSSIADVCVREQLLGLRNGIKRKDISTISWRVTYDIGNALHAFLQNGVNYLGSKRLGWWRCSACGHKFFGKVPAQNCRQCGALSEAIRYMEHTLSLSDDIPVSGHPDMFMEVSPGDIRVVDFKTINGDDFDRLTAPNHDHIMQVNGYMEYLQMDDSIPVSINKDSGFVLYISKKHAAKSLPFKMFHIERTPIFLEAIQEKVENFKHGLADDKYLPPPNSKCSIVNYRSGRGKSCPVSALCSQ